MKPGIVAPAKLEKVGTGNRLESMPQRPSSLSLASSRTEPRDQSSIERLHAKSRPLSTRSAASIPAPRSLRLVEPVRSRTADSGFGLGQNDEPAWGSHPYVDWQGERRAWQSDGQEIAWPLAWHKPRPIYASGRRRKPLLSIDSVFLAAVLSTAALLWFSSL